MMVIVIGRRAERTLGALRDQRSKDLTVWDHLLGGSGVIIASSALVGFYLGGAHERHLAAPRDKSRPKE